jgi:putative transposase
MTNIRRYSPNGAPLFITAVTADREPFLQTNENKQLLLDVIREVKTQHGFAMLGYAILDDHFHFLINPNDNDSSKLMQSIKLRFTRRFAKLNAGVEKQPVSLWQRRFWDHIIRDEDDFQRHLDYIHYNPVKHGIVRSANEYLFSSFRVYVERGAYGLDWGVDLTPPQISTMEIE